MSIEVNPDWWKTMFDATYLLTDARSVCDNHLTSREVNVICDLLPIDKNHTILDMCGGHGRHSMELCARGYTHCTLLDYSDYLLDCAAETAGKNNYPITFVQGDARNTDFSSESFDHVIIMGNSLGYVGGELADYKILKEGFRILRFGGWMLVDVSNGAEVKESFNPYAWHEIGEDTVVCRQRVISGDTIKAREMVISKGKGLIRDRTYSMRIYDAESLKTLFQKVGYTDISVYTGFSRRESDKDYGFMNRRMIVMGRKPAG